MQQPTLSGLESPEILRARADAMQPLTTGTAREQVFRDCVRRLLELGFLYTDPWRIRQPGGEPDANTWGHEEDTQLWTTPDTYVPAQLVVQGRMEQAPEYSPSALEAIQRQGQR